MKNRFYFFVLAFISQLPFDAKAQWTSSGSAVYTTGSVGIGYFNNGPLSLTPIFPSAKLHVQGGILSTGTYGDISVSGPGARLMWIPYKYAFRAGYAAGAEWDDASIGYGSSATGYGCKANGYYSSASGEFTTASGYASAAFGVHSNSGANSSFAAGYYSTASGYNSTALGGYNTAGGDYSLAIGQYVKASGTGSIAIGNGYSTPNEFTNSIDNSLMVGFNSLHGPALFVAPGNGAGGAFGKVGIGTTTPQSELAVNGMITAKGLELYASSWPDYVFTNTYKLRSLKETEQFINEHKHLPGVPSEKEILEKGLNVGEMNKIMMEKIEELTLHMIELEKQNESLKELVKELKK